MSKYVGFIWARNEKMRINLRIKKIGGFLYYKLLSIFQFSCTYKINGCADLEYEGIYTIQSELMQQREGIYMFSRN